VCSTYTVKEIDDVHERLLQYAERVRQFAIKLQNEHPVISARLAAEADAQAIAEQSIEPPPPTPPDYPQE
jgi:hypothetical protein